MMQNDDGAAVARLNAGEPIAPLEFSWIERAWNLMNHLDRERRQTVGIHLGAIAGNDANLASLSPDQRIAFSFRYALLDALIMTGILACAKTQQSTLHFCVQRGSTGPISVYSRCIRRPGCRPAARADELPAGPGPNRRSYCY
jgi:hypothetical protein